MLISDISHDEGQYANAILRFRVDFPDDYPSQPPIVRFLSDVFHPLVTPLTTYTYSTRDTGTETVSAADRNLLPAGGLSLRHGFPEWFGGGRDGASNKESSDADVKQKQHSAAHTPSTMNGAPLTVEVLQYLRVVFDTEALLDAVPLEAAANTGAWHAWKSYRSKTSGGRASPATRSSSSANETASDRSTSPRQQPGGARRPGEWNWQGVWEDRVRKCIQASLSENMLYGSEQSDVVCFSKMAPESVQGMLAPLRSSAKS